MKLISSVGLLGVAAAMLAGCGGHSLSATCANASACGGDVTGTWTIASNCLSITDTNFESACPAATLMGTNIKITGTQTYNADLTYTIVGTLSFGVVVNVPMSCISLNGLTLSCAQVSQLLLSNGQTMGATCTTAGTGCACTLAVPDVDIGATGTYTTANGVLTAMPVGGAAEQNGYCVRGNAMTQSPVSATVMGAAVTGTVNYTK
jgi:hypothetical protein